MSKYVYLAAPYSHEDRLVRVARYEDCLKAVGMLVRHDIFAYSPIVHWHPVAFRCDLPTGYDFWGRLDEAMISRLDEVWVLMIEGWKSSTGVELEIALAHELGKPVHYILPNIASLTTFDVSGIIPPNA